MPDVEIKYNNATIASLSDSGTEVLETNGTYLTDDITVEYTKPTPNLQSKSASPTTSSQTITADSGYDGLSQVTVNAISPIKAAQTYTPSTTDQTIQSGRWLTGAQTIKGDANLISGNIKSGVSIFGVTGTYEGSGGGGDTVVDFIENHNTISSFEHSSITKVGDGAFARCTALKSVNIPACTSIGYSAFDRCVNLSVINFPVCTSIGSFAFNSCMSLRVANFPSCTKIDSCAFYGCFSLSTASFPLCSIIEYQAFQYCYNLTTISFPVCSVISASAFASCYSLATASFPSCTSIYNYAFNKCYRLVSLYLLGSSIISLLYSNAFNSTPIAGYTTSTGGVYGSIYVPSSLLSSYKTATNWTYFSSRIVGI